jgi:outer membrane protein OmpA-like peptidoglycan-associated protein
MARVKTAFVKLAPCLAVLMLAGCVSRAYVDEQVAEARDRSDGVDRRLGGSERGDDDSGVPRRHQLSEVDDSAANAPAPAPDSVDHAATVALGRPDTSKVEEQTVLFRSGSSELSHEDEDMLTDLAQRVKSDDKRAYIEIRGYADTQGDAHTNEELGWARAGAVYAFLAGQGVPLEQMSNISKGEDDPATSNDTAQGRAHNRRVVVTVVE